MTLNEILFGGGLGVVCLLSLVQIAPIKINPWSALARAFGKAINADMLKELGDTKKALEEHVRIDDERNADMHRGKILAFNTELLRGEEHTREDFIEIMAEIDFYEKYCHSHTGYRNNRAVHAIANIGRVYDELMKTGDFLGELHQKP